MGNIKGMIESVDWLIRRATEKAEAINNKNRTDFLMEFVEIDKKKILCLDTETTGLNKNKDEILQLSIVNGLGELLVNDYFKPERHDSWEDAQRINGISPEFVADKDRFAWHVEEYQKIIDSADMVIGYNVGFDIDMLICSGLSFIGKYKFDVMLKFSELTHQKKWKKLVECAMHYGYRFRAHDSLEDSRATLFCYFKMFEQTKRIVAS